MRLLILSDFHMEFEKFELPKELNFDVAVLTGDIPAPGRLAAGWTRLPTLVPDKLVILVAINSSRYMASPVWRADESTAGVNARRESLFGALKVTRLPAGQR